MDCVVGEYVVVDFCDYYDVCVEVCGCDGLVCVFVVVVEFEVWGF